MFKDHIWLQKKGFELLLQQAEAKRAEIVSLKADIEELNKSLVDKKEPVRSQFEIETLRGEIRELTNDKWKLENKINISLKVFLNFKSFKVKNFCLKACIFRISFSEYPPKMKPE